MTNLNSKLLSRIILRNSPSNTNISSNTFILPCDRHLRLHLIHPSIHPSIHTYIYAYIERLITLVKSAASNRARQLKHAGHRHLDLVVSFQHQRVADTEERDRRDSLTCGFAAKHSLALSYTITTTTTIQRENAMRSLRGSKKKKKRNSSPATKKEKKRKKKKYVTFFYSISLRVLL